MRRHKLTPISFLARSTVVSFFKIAFNSPNVRNVSESGFLSLFDSFFDSFDVFDDVFDDLGSLFRLAAFVGLSSDAFAKIIFF